jgi:lysophospholipase L1-like esterase
MKITRRWAVAAGLAAALVAGTIAGVGTAQAESNGGVKVMPLGDSITEGTQVPGGYRIGLWQRVVSGGYRVDFVGSQFNGPSNLGDHDHEGHPGWRIDQIDANINPWLLRFQPHTVLLHIGTNDVLQNYNVSSAPSRLSTLIDHITSTVPTAEVFVAQLTPLSNSGQENAVRTFNAAIPGIVQSKVNSGKHVHLVDMHSAVGTGDLTDGIHPTAGGYDKMAAVWYNALRSVNGSIGNNGSPTPTASSASPTRSPSASVSPSRSVSPSASASRSVTPTDSVSPQPGGCTASYAIANTWPGGMQAAVTVTNTSTATLNGWTVRWTLPSGQTITQLWNGTLTISGSSVTVQNMTWNGTLAPGASAIFGMLIEGSSTAVPTTSCSSP